MRPYKQTVFNDVRFVCAIAVTGLLAALFLSGCKEKASNDDIHRMCTHLAELRNSAGDKQMISQCIAEATAEPVSKKQALCRIFAVNKQEYWIRCRTGEPRPPAQ